MSQMSHVSLGLPGTSLDVPAKSQLHSLVPCPRCPMYPWDYLGHPGMSHLRASYTAMSHVQDVLCIPGITWDILGSLGLLGTSWDIPAKSQLHSVFPCHRCPTYPWDYLGHPGMSQIRASYTALSPAQNVPCIPGITWDILGWPT